MSNEEQQQQEDVKSDNSASSDKNQLHDHLTTPIMKSFFPTSSQNQEEEEKRMQQAALEFNKFLKEAVEFDEMKLFDDDQSEIRSQKRGKLDEMNLQKMDGFGGQQIYQDDAVIREAVFNLKKIQNEEEQLLQHFITLSKQMDVNDKGNIKRIRDFFEALNYEMAIRSKEKAKLFDRILFKEDQLYKHIRLVENSSRKLEKDYTSIRKFHEIRSLRQTGRFKGNPQNNQRVKAPPSVSAYTMGQEFLTKDTHNNQQDLLYNEKSVNQPNAITTTSQQPLQQKQVVVAVEKNGGEEIIIDETSVYDWIVDIDLITNVAKDGWQVYLSKKFADQQSQQGMNSKSVDGSPTIEKQQQLQQQQYIGRKKDSYYGFEEGQSKSGWEGATVAVVGLYDKGKTFVLNNLTQSNLPSGKKVNTKGISFKHVNVDSGTHLILVDTAGSYSPVRIVNELSIVEKEATEMFIMDLVFEISDYFICVVNDFTSLDQRYLDRLSRNLQNSPNKTFREIIVIHNLKEVESPEILEHVWSTQVTQIYQNGSIQKTKVAAINTISGQLQEKHVLWFKTQYTRHVCLVNDDSYLGVSINPWVFSLLRYWLKAVFVPVNRPFSVVDSIITFSKVKLSSYFRTNLNLKIQDTEDMLQKRIVTEQEIVDNVRIPQVSIDSSGLIMKNQLYKARPDSFLPATDIIATDKYIIYMDVPGLTKDEILVYRQNVITIIKGIRKKPYTNEKLEKSERKYGEFALSFKIPEIYERKWSVFSVENGVLTIIYDKDKDDQIVRTKRSTSGKEQ